MDKWASSSEGPNQVTRPHVHIRNQTPCMTGACTEEAVGILNPTHDSTEHLGRLPHQRPPVRICPRIQQSCNTFSNVKAQFCLVFFIYLFVSMCLLGLVNSLQVLPRSQGLLARPASLSDSSHEHHSCRGCAPRRCFGLPQPMRSSVILDRLVSLGGRVVDGCHTCGRAIALVVISCLFSHIECYSTVSLRPPHPVKFDPKSSRRMCQRRHYDRIKNLIDSSGGQLICGGSTATWLLTGGSYDPLFATRATGWPGGARFLEHGATQTGKRCLR